MRSSRLLYFLFVSVTLVVVPADTAEISETFGNPLRSEEVVDAPKANGTRWEVLEAVTNRIHFDNLGGVRQEDVYRFYLWERYKRSSRSERLETVKEIRELFTHMAYLDRTMDMIGMLIFGPENGPLILRSASRNSLNDDWQCRRSSMVLFEKHCAVLFEHTMRHLRFFSNICNNVAVKTSIEEAFIAACGRNAIPYGIDVGHPTVDVNPIPIQGSSKGSKDGESCQRVPVHGISRMELQSYAKAYRVMLVPSVVIPDKWHNRIQICFHGNASLGLCQCEKDDWRSIHKGSWSSLMSPYEQRFVDVKLVDGVSGSVTVTLDEVSQGWCYILLAVGIVLLFSAPAVSNWVSFYYTSSMTIEVFAVVLILLYQLGAGSFLVHYVAILVNSILANFGFSQVMQNPVSVFLLLLIILLGASLGYWLVRKYIFSEDGDVDEGVAQFIKWAMRVIAVTSIFMSSIDTPLAMVAVGSSLALYCAISSIRWCNDEVPTLSKRLKLWQRSGQKTPKAGRAEFLSCPQKFSPLGSPWDCPRNSFAWSDSPVKGMVNASVDRGSPGSQQDFYSTFHKTPNRKKFSKREWVEFTEESTRELVAELTSTPEFTDWMTSNANRIKLFPDNGSDDNANGSDSTDGYGVKNSNRSRFFSW